MTYPPIGSVFLICKMGVMKELSRAKVVILLHSKSHLEILLKIQFAGPALQESDPVGLGRS